MKTFNMSEDDGTGRHFCYYGEEELGYIEYYKKWKKWVWNQGEDIIMSLSCMEKVVNKLKEFEGR